MSHLFTFWLVLILVNIKQWNNNSLSNLSAPTIFWTQIGGGGGHALFSKSFFSQWFFVVTITNYFPPPPSTQVTSGMLLLFSVNAESKSFTVDVGILFLFTWNSSNYSRLMMHNEYILFIIMLNFVEITTMEVTTMEEEY